MGFTYQWGHPYEHQLLDAPLPQSVIVLAPDGKKTDLTSQLERIELAGGEGKKVAGYRFRFTPPRRGDYLFLLQTPPIWMAEDGEFLQDTVKVILHVQSQRGWDSGLRADLEFRPLTRPYGLLPGMVFQAQLEGRVNRTPPRASLADFLVEVERYNLVPPKELPPDEFITRTARTDPQGVVTTTLPEPGWWALTAGREEGTREHEGKAQPVRRRSTLWVHVSEKPTGK
jgi:uncharacterized GH25 family protein